MDQMLNSIIEHPVAGGAGIFGMVCLAAYPMFRSRPLLLTAYLANNCGFATHYALLGDGTAELMNTVIGAQTLVAVSLVRWPVLRWLYYALMMVSFGGAAITWHGWPSFFCLTATSLSALGRLQRSETPMRTLMLSSSPFWGVHDLLIGSLPGLVADMGSTATGTLMLLRHLQQRSDHRAGQDRLASNLSADAPPGSNGNLVNSG